MCNFTWNPHIDTNIESRIEKEIKLQIIDIHFENIRPLNVAINLKKENAEIVVCDANNAKLKSFSLFDNGTFTTISSTDFSS